MSNEPPRPKTPAQVIDDEAGLRRASAHTSALASHDHNRRRLDLACSWARWAIGLLPREYRNAASIMWHEGSFPHAIDIEAKIEMLRREEKMKL